MRNLLNYFKNIVDTLKEPCQDPDCKGCQLTTAVRNAAGRVLRNLHGGTMKEAIKGLEEGIVAIEDLYVRTWDPDFLQVRADWLHVLANIRELEKQQKFTERMVLSGLFDNRSSNVQN